MLVETDWTIRFKGKNSQHFVAKIVADILTTTYNISHVEFEHGKELPKELISPQLVHKNQISRFDQVGSIMIKPFLLFLSDILNPNPDQQVHHTENKDHLGVEIGIGKIVRKFN